MTSRAARRVVALATLAIVWAATPARADLIRITPRGVTVPEQDATGNTSPVPILGDGFRLTYHSQGNVEAPIFDPLEVIIGIPVVIPGSATAPALNDVLDSGFISVDIDLGDTQNRYDGTWDVDTGFAGTFSDPGPGNPKVYEFIGFNPDGVDSQNFTNWSFDNTSGFTQWDLFVYAVTFNPDMTRGTWVEFETNLPLGSYVIGYGCTKLNTSGLCKTEGSTQSTPFTFAGYVTEVPEPGSLSILGVGLILAAGARRRQAQ